MACEQAMFEATDGVNTHKGGIFSLGLICFAAGRLRGLNRLVCAQSVCQQVAEICKGLVARSWLPARMRQRRVKNSINSLA
jgi:triphosphoribosyl-dephospho-CoA synthase